MIDRREVRRQYKESGTRVGVFAIKNAVNGRTYVGGSLNVDGALNRTRFELDRKCHRNTKLQGDWSEHGAASFTCEVLDTVKKREDPGFDYEGALAELVALWREELQCLGESGYNV